MSNLKQVRVTGIMCWQPLTYFSNKIPNLKKIYIFFFIKWEGDKEKNKKLHRLHHRLKNTLPLGDLDGSGLWLRAVLLRPQTPTQFSYMQGIFIMHWDTGSGPPYVC